MNQQLAQETYAVVVGIEQYQMGSNLSRDGIAKNALDFTDWLLNCGLPKENISLFISELEKDDNQTGNKKLIAKYTQDKNIEIKKATRDNISKTIFEEIPKKQGKLFYFYWLGHGFITNVTQRQLLYADTTENTSGFNLSSFIESLKTDTFPNFDEQILFVDACAVYASSTSRKIYFGENLAKEEYKIGKPKSRQQFSFLASQEGDTAKFDDLKKTAIFSKILLEILSNKSSLFIPEEMKDLAEEIKGIFQKDYPDYSEPISLFYQDKNGNVEQISLNSINNNKPIPRNNDLERDFNDLIDSEKEALIDQIAYYYDDEQRLRTIFTLNHQIFGFNFYGRVQGNDPYTKTINLTQELIRRKLMNNFVKICRKEYADFAKNL